MSHAFISYVRENTADVDRLCAALNAAGIEVWLDREKIKPGTPWKDAISQAIEQGAFFIACFSNESRARERSHQNEEITLAITELRRRSGERVWFIPVVLSGVGLPRRSIDAGRMLADLDWVDLTRDWAAGVQRLIEALVPGKHFREAGSPMPLPVTGHPAMTGKRSGVRPRRNWLVAALLPLVALAIWAVWWYSAPIIVYGKVHVLGDRRRGITAARVFFDDQATVHGHTDAGGNFQFRTNRGRTGRDAWLWAEAEGFEPSEQETVLLQRDGGKIFLGVAPRKMLPSGGTKQNGAATRVQIRAETITVNRTCDSGNQAKHAELQWAIAIDDGRFASDGKLAPGVPWILEKVETVTVDDGLPHNVTIQMRELDDDGKTVGNTDRETITIQPAALWASRSIRQDVQMWRGHRRCSVDVALSAHVLPAGT